MIKNIIFDIGDVLVTFSWESLFHKFNLTEQQFNRIAKATVKSDIWKEVDRGVWSYQQIIDEFVNNDPVDQQLIKEIFRSFDGIVTKRDYSIDWIKSYKDRGFNCYYLSNFNDYTIDSNPEVMKFLDYMDGGVFSHHVKLIKPDYRIYNSLLDKYALKADECIFIDDNLANCIAASELGINAVNFTDLQNVKEKVEMIITKSN